MSPKIADPALRTTLVEVAARLVATEGPGGLTLRRLASEVGTSTMAVYTHFGSMGDLRREIRREGFARLDRHLAEVEPTDDPVSDLARIGSAYYASATAEPNLYRAMFLEGPVDDADVATGLGAFGRLVTGVRRAVEAGRLTGDPDSMAVQLWSAAHGIVTLHFAGLLTGDDAVRTLLTLGANLLTAFGDTSDRLARSLDAAVGAGDGWSLAIAASAPGLVEPGGSKL